VYTNKLKSQYNRVKYEIKSIFGKVYKKISQPNLMWFFSRQCLNLISLMYVRPITNQHIVVANIKVFKVIVKKIKDFKIKK